MAKRGRCRQWCGVSKRRVQAGWGQRRVGWLTGDCSPVYHSRWLVSSWTTFARDFRDVSPGDVAVTYDELAACGFSLLHEIFAGRTGGEYGAFGFVVFQQAPLWRVFRWPFGWAADEGNRRRAILRRSF